MNDELKVQIVSKPCVGMNVMHAKLGHAIVNYIQAHSGIFETDQYKEWLVRYRERQEKGHPHKWKR